MQTSAPRFYPGLGPPPSLPLARFLPPLPPGMAAGWLAENVPPGSLLLDPLGASPALALEAARAGYRVLVASNNPILSFLLETLAGAPQRAAFQAALAELGSARRGEERLEQHLQGLYQTECEACGTPVAAQAFLWRKNETQPFARQYRCPHCGEGGAGGTREISQGDLERLAAMGGDKLQRARALQRVLRNEEEQRADVEEALENYGARPLYVLFTLLNRIEGLGLAPERLRLLRALLISAFDAGSALWPWPGGRARPRQLGVPPQYRENNLWAALEAAVDDWAQPGQRPVPVTHWPELPPAGSGGAICLFRGRVKALMPLPEEMQPGAVLTVFPRPNQAFWTLSVLWTGWLWGAEAALPLRNVLDRRRYDWHWHTAAIHSALAAVGANLPGETPLFGLLPELAPGFLSAALVAAEAAGFRLDGLALRADAQRRAEQDIGQGLWHGGPAVSDSAEKPAGRGMESRGMESAAREAMRADLLARGEPAAYLALYASGLQAMVRGGCLPRGLNSIPGDLLTRVQAVMARTFADRSLLRLYRRAQPRPAAIEAPKEAEGDPLRLTAGEESGLEEASFDAGGAWWLNAPPPPAGGEMTLPLADRVEMETVRFMQKQLNAGQAGFTFAELDQALCAQFRGLHTPPADLLQACLESYGEASYGELPPTVAGGERAPVLWRMRASESAAARKADLQEMRAAIETVGARLGFVTREEGSALVWEQEKGGIENPGGAENSGEQWWFFRMASSILSRYVLAANAPGPLKRCVLVLPGSRARLLANKLQRDPRLSEAVRGWRFLKFRHLREIAAQPGLDMTGWQPLLDEDPLTDEASQMRLL